MTAVVEIQGPVSALLDAVTAPIVGNVCPDAGKRKNARPAAAKRT